MARRRKNNTPSTPPAQTPGRDARQNSQVASDPCGGDAGRTGEFVGERLTAARPRTSSPRVLVAVRCPEHRAAISAHLGLGDFRVIHTDAARDAMRRLNQAEYDAVILQTELPDAVGHALAKRIVESYPGLAVVLSSDHPTLDDASAAIRCGAADLLTPAMSSVEFVARVNDALRRARVSREREEKIRRLQRACRELNKARELVSTQVGSLCEDLATAYQHMTDRASDAASCAELNERLRQELDIEGLLRAVLEFVLAKAGPTNASIFLPATSGDFTLGAYINYDGPKDTAETLLDHLASTIAPRLEHQTTLLDIRGRAPMLDRLGPEADWIDESHMLGLACHEDGECLAVFLVHREVAKPFDESFVRLMPTIGALFAKQLSRIIHVHHRHLPKHKWGLKPGSLGEEGPDIDLAA
jgi:DNA-binding response OmpR family regulator